MKLSSLLLGASAVLLSSLPMRAKPVSVAVDYEQGGVQLEGYLAYDDSVTASGKVPGVLVVPEWWGLTDYAKHRADQLAGLGYVAFAVDMYGKGVTTTDARKATELSAPFYGSPLMAARARAGLDRLLATGLVDPSRVAAIGYCFGGSTVQALAYTGAPLAGIVSFHGGLIPVPDDAAAKTVAKILVCQGALDPFVPKKDRDTFTKAMDEGKFDYQFITYSGAVHAFTNPGADELARANGLGAAIAYNAEADRRSWEAMRAFFEEIFAAK
jgi:dienelactone hydrolase